LTNDQTVNPKRTGGGFCTLSTELRRRRRIDADIPDVILPCMILKSDPARIMAAEQKAKALADKGLWRRAAGVYTDMFSIACSSVEVARIAKARNECLRMARRA